MVTRPISRKLIFRALPLAGKTALRLCARDASPENGCILPVPGLFQFSFVLGVQRPPPEPSCRSFSCTAPVLFIPVCPLAAKASDPAREISERPCGRIMPHVTPWYFCLSLTWHVSGERKEIYSINFFRLLFHLFILWYGSIAILWIFDLLSGCDLLVMPLL